MTVELIVVAALVASALAYLVRKLLLRERSACDKCAVHQAADGRQRRAGGASPSSGPTR